ncbi:hypothetical protein L9F63_001746 [Diploptera punctata]|uniref:Uncharacterized protein n=1 Tax=Diploptera punctata TaxID=6984 RepID=A0AAD8EIQ4_DIPPU|nr:hypothetical protein L9F63_001746 [Diploptera punctata]
MDVPLFSWSDFIAGWTAGVCGLIIGHPLDTMKVRQQTFQHPKVLGIFLQTLKYEGIHGFYKGMGFPLLAAGALNSVFFGVYGTCLRVLEKHNKSADTSHNANKGFNIFLAGVVGGIATISVGCPVDLVKIQLQSQTGSQGHRRHIGPISIVVEILRKNGIRGLYKGGHTMIYRDSFSSGIYFWSYAEILTSLKEKDDDDNGKHALAVVIAGGIAGVLSWASIMPLDLIKSRIQADDMANPKFKGIVDCAVKSYKKDGLSVFGRGLTMCCIRSFPVNGATFLGYEICLKYCHIINDLYFQH